MEKFKVILASASPRRRDLLEQIGIKAEIMPSDIDENTVTQVPSQVVEELSAKKAEAVWQQYNGRDRERIIVLGSDTVVSAEGRILGKPESEEAARDMIRMLQGNCHQVYTGVTLKSGKSCVTFSVKTDVYVYPMSEEEIAGYVACGESMDKAGAYGIQGRFAAFIERIEGSYTNVMGLPAGRVYQQLKQLTEEQND